MAEEMKTPREWAIAKGVFKPARFPWEEATVVDQRWPSALALYLWDEHAHNYQAPERAFRLSEADFERGLDAAFNHPPARPHAAAIPPEYQQRFPADLFAAQPPAPAPAPPEPPPTEPSEES